MPRTPAGSKSTRSSTRPPNYIIEDPLNLSSGSRHSSNERSRNTRSTRSDVSTSRRTSSLPAGTQSRRTLAKRKSLPKKRIPPVLMHIRQLQKTTNNLIPRLPFSRLIREVLGQFSNENLRITFSALEAIQEFSEIYLVHLFEDSYKCTLHRDRVTLMIKDMELARSLRGNHDPGNFQ